MNKIFFILMITCSFFIKNIWAQAPLLPNKLYEQNPVWIGMMDDSTANYFETIKAYDSYFTKHEKPEDEEGELMGEGKEKLERYFFWRKKKMEREAQERNWLRFQCKRMEQWKKDNLPYVQPDGRILTMQQRVRIFNQSQTKK
ncbi:MAG: hypothetical protein RJA07_2721 [Bacteroidota bacterium]|jgi:hypothetical protein